MILNCENHLDVFGEYKDLVDFFEENRVKPNKKKLVNENILTFSKTVPVKDENNSLECKENWGTKQNAEVKDWENDMEEETDQIFYIFLTPKNPPNLWLKKIAEKYTNLEFNLVYQNVNDDISGEIVYRNGKLYNSVRNNHSEEIWNYIGDDLMLELKETISKFKEKDLEKIIELLKDKESSQYKKLSKLICDFDENGKYVINYAFESLIVDYENLINDEMEAE